MQIPASQFNGIQIMSLQTGLMIGSVAEPLVDPRKLAVIAFAVKGHMVHGNELYLRIADVREAGKDGLIVDSQDELVELEDVIYLQEVYGLHFSPVGLRVIDDHKHKLGTVQDFTLELGNMVIQQLVVKPPLLKSMRESELLIHRSQIVKLTNDTVVVKAPTEEADDPIPSAVRAYSNPFREGGQRRPATEQAKQQQ